jgi:hypothetical protein
MLWLWNSGNGLINFGEVKIFHTLSPLSQSLFLIYFG